MRINPNPAISNNAMNTDHLSAPSTPLEPENQATHDDDDDGCQVNLFAEETVMAPMLDHAVSTPELKASSLLLLKALGRKKQVSEDDDEYDGWDLKDDELKQRARAQAVDFKNSNFTKITAKQLFGYGVATSLDISGNRLQVIPGKPLGRIGNLRRLALGKNNLVEVPRDIGRLEHLVWLDLTYNSVSRFPQEISNCRHLASLGFGENRMDEFPEVLCRLPIVKMGAFNNLIRSLPPSIKFLAPSLIKLDLSGNMLRELPGEFCCLHRLQWLNLSQNQLQRLPEAFGDLANMQEISLASNRLRHLPDSMRKMQSLKILPVFNNSLEQVPEWLGSLQSLERADFSNNAINSVPLGAFTGPRMHQLFLRGNRISSLPLLPPDQRGHFQCNLQLIDVRDNLLPSVPHWLFRGHLAVVPANAASENGTSTAGTTVIGWTVVQREVHLTGNPLLSDETEDDPNLAGFLENSENLDVSFHAGTLKDMLLTRLLRATPAALRCHPAQKFDLGTAGSSSVLLCKSKPEDLSMILREAYSAILCEDATAIKDEKNKPPKASSEPSVARSLRENLRMCECCEKPFYSPLDLHCLDWRLLFPTASTSSNSNGSSNTVLTGEDAGEGGLAVPVVMRVCGWRCWLKVQRHRRHYRLDHSVVESNVGSVIRED